MKSSIVPNAFPVADDQLKKIRLANAARIALG